MEINIEIPEELAATMTQEEMEEYAAKEAEKYAVALIEKELQAKIKRLGLG